MGRVILLFLAVIFIIAGCRSSKTIEQVPVLLPQHHERIETSSDSVSVTDSVSECNTTIIQEVDSPFLAGLGIINPPKKAWLLQNKQIRHEKKSLNHTSNDSVKERNTIPVPYPVPQIKEVYVLHWWQKLYLWVVTLFSIYCLIYGLMDIYKLKKRI